MSGSDHVKPAGSGLKLTYDDFVLFPDDGKRHESIDGEHYVTRRAARALADPKSCHAKVATC